MMLAEGLIVRARTVAEVRSLLRSSLLHEAGKSINKTCSAHTRTSASMSNTRHIFNATGRSKPNNINHADDAAKFRLADPVPGNCRHHHSIVRAFSGSSSAAVGRGVVDLRSDTVTLPCKRLRAAMSGAKVGDDVFGEDPTVNRLEECAAMLLGKEKGLLVPSGTMGNLIAVGAHCRRGDEIILGKKAHLFHYEGTGASAFMGVAYHTVNNMSDGTLDLTEMAAAIRGDDPHYPRSSLLCIENTQNLCGAKAISQEGMGAMCAVAREAGLKVHVDGARIWNAAAALRVRPSELVADADTVSACLSKGLGAPVGSVLVGSEEFIYQARRLRKALGGGMRQAGVVAAAGLEAMVNNFNRLEEDHENAEVLANGLAAIPGITAERCATDTNAVYFQVTGMNPQAFVDALHEDHGVRMGSGYFGGSTVRAMTHLNVDREGVERAIDAARTVLAAGGGG